MCKWPAVNGIVVLAIKSGKYADEEILAALLRMAKENRSVTVDSLRTEIGGMPPRRPGSSGGDRPSGWVAAGSEFQAMVDGHEGTQA